MVDFGYNSMWLNDAWKGVDFFAVHLDGEQMLRGQLQSHIAINREYLNKISTSHPLQEKIQTFLILKNMLTCSSRN
jgi:hypothetical protein